MLMAFVLCHIKIVKDGIPSLSEAFHILWGEEYDENLQKDGKGGSGCVCY